MPPESLRTNLKSILGIIAQGGLFILLVALALRLFAPPARAADTVFGYNADYSFPPAWDATVYDDYKFFGSTFVATSSQTSLTAFYAYAINDVDYWSSSTLTHTYDIALCEGAPYDPDNFTDLMNCNDPYLTNVWHEAAIVGGTHITNPTGNWIRFPLSVPQMISPGSIYTILVRIHTGNVPIALGLAIRETGGIYAQGIGLWSHDGHTVSTSTSVSDVAFQLGSDYEAAVAVASTSVTFEWPKYEHIYDIKTNDPTCVIDETCAFKFNTDAGNGALVRFYNMTGNGVSGGVLMASTSVTHRGGWNNTAALIYSESEPSTKYYCSQLIYLGKIYAECGHKVEWVTQAEYDLRTAQSLCIANAASSTNANCTEAESEAWFSFSCALKKWSNWAFTPGSDTCISIYQSTQLANATFPINIYKKIDSLVKQAQKSTSTAVVLPLLWANPDQPIATTSATWLSSAGVRNSSSGGLFIQLYDWLVILIYGGTIWYFVEKLLGNLSGGAEYENRDVEVYRRGRVSITRRERKLKGFKYRI